MLKTSVIVIPPDGTLVDEGIAGSVWLVSVTATEVEATEHPVDTIANSTAITVYSISTDKSLLLSHMTNLGGLICIDNTSRSITSV